MLIAAVLRGGEMGGPSRNFYGVEWCVYSTMIGMSVPGAPMSRSMMSVVRIDGSSRHFSAPSRSGPPRVVVRKCDPHPWLTAAG